MGLYDKFILIYYNLKQIVYVIPEEKESEL